jgi:hypothetical protein
VTFALVERVFPQACRWALLSPIGEPRAGSCDVRSCKASEELRVYPAGQAAVTAEVVRAFRGSEALRPGAVVTFAVSVLTPDTPRQRVPRGGTRWTDYGALRAAYLEVFLNGQPPACEVALWQLATIRRQRRGQPGRGGFRSPPRYGRRRGSCLGCSGGGSDRVDLCSRRHKRATAAGFPSDLSHGSLNTRRKHTIRTTSWNPNARCAT